MSAATAKPSCGAHEHHALDAEVEHSRLLAHELPERGEQQRSAGAQGGGGDGGDQSEIRHRPPAPREVAIAPAK